MEADAHGDTTDNIKGIPKIGDKKADKLLLNCQTSDECEEVVKNQYEIVYGDMQQYEINYKLLYILRSRDAVENLS